MCVCRGVGIKREDNIIGARLSEPHTDELYVSHVYMLLLFCTSYHKSLLALILRVLASFINSKTIHKLLSSARRHETSTSSMATASHLWTYLFNG